MIKAGIDIGTNTILLLIAEVDRGKILNVLRDEVRVVRLGQGVDQFAAFQTNAMARAERCFHEYREILNRYPGIDCKIVATSGARDAKNSHEFFQRMEAVIGFPISIISGDAEAAFSFGGALSDHTNVEDYTVIDIGGGSTEIVMLDASTDESIAIRSKPGRFIRKSFDVGCVRLNERFVKHDPPRSQELETIRTFVRGELSKCGSLLNSFKQKKLLGVAGTVTYAASSLLNLKQFDPSRVHGARIEVQGLKNLLSQMSTLKSQDRLGIGGMDSGRADVILAGLIILQEFMEACGSSSMEVSVRGLRYGLLLSETEL